MCIQIICILDTEESVQMSQLRIKEWPTHRPPVTQKINKRLRAVYKTSWTTQPSRIKVYSLHLKPKSGPGGGGGGAPKKPTLRLWSFHFTQEIKSFKTI